MRLYPLAALALIAGACAPKAEAPAAASTPTALGAAELDSVKAVDAAFAAGINAKDTAAVFKVYAPDAKVMPQDAPILEGADAHAGIAGLIAGGASGMTLKPTLTYGVGDLAYQVGTATWTMSGKAESVKYTEVLRKGADGKWRYVVDMFSSMSPAAAAPAARK